MDQYQHHRTTVYGGDDHLNDHSLTKVRKKVICLHLMQSTGTSIVGFTGIMRVTYLMLPILIHRRESSHSRLACSLQMPHTPLHVFVLIVKGILHIRRDEEPSRIGRIALACMTASAQRNPITKVPQEFNVQQASVPKFSEFLEEGQFSLFSPNDGRGSSLYNIP